MTLDERRVQAILHLLGLPFLDVLRVFEVAAMLQLNQVPRLVDLALEAPQEGLNAAAGTERGIARQRKRTGEGGGSALGR